MNRTKCLVFVLAAPLSCLLSACLGTAAGAEESLASDSAALSAERCYCVEDAQRELLSFDARHSELSQTQGAAGFLSVADQKLLFMAPGENILRSRRAARDYFERTDPSDVIRTSWQASRADVSASADFGYTFGWTTQTTTQPDGTLEVLHGKYTNVWRRKGRKWNLIVHARTRAVAIEPTPTPADFPLLPSGRHCVEPQKPRAALAGAFAADTAFAELSMSSGEEEAFFSYAAPDAVLLGAGLPIVIGPEAIGALYAGDPPEDTLDWAPVDGAVASTGDLGFTIGEATITDGEPTGDTLYYSKYLTLWQKQDDGEWLYIGDIGSARPAPAP
jgi:ketosteroid isomerase-like protein